MNGLKEEAGNKISTALLVNTAACSGILNECSFLRANGFNDDDFQSQFLLNIGDWALECLGVSGKENLFWNRWEEGASSAVGALSVLEPEDVGMLCRCSPSVLNNREFSSDMNQNIIAMYRCYEHSLLEPRGVGWTQKFLYLI